jgi:nucleotide-binding universal stress UspA family protein
MTDRDTGGMLLSDLDGVVVVGDDGSKAAARAVEWALADAGRRDVPLVVVRAWSITSAPRPADAEPGYVPSEDEFAEAVREEMAGDLRGVLGEAVVAGDGRVLLMPAHCGPVDALLTASRHAALTVVGARGSGLARWLGSVSSAVVRAAEGPVVVVPDRSRATA